MSRFRHYLFVALVFAVAGVASVWLWQHEQHNTAQGRRETLDFNLREITSSIEQRVASYGQVMLGVHALLATSDRIDTKKLQAYVEALQLGADFAGLDEISVSGLRPSAGSMILEADPDLREAMQAARDSGRLTMTGKLKAPLSNKGQAQVNFVMFMPLYKGGRHPDTLAERRTNLQGWVVAPVQMNDLMASLYGNHVPGNDIKIYDGVQMSPESLMFDSTQSASTQAVTPLEQTEYLVLAGRTWAVTVRERADSAALVARDSSRLMALGGAGFTLLLTLLAWVLVTGRARALAAARVMTSELREVKERFELIFDTSPDAVMVTRLADGIVVDINKRFTVLTGFSREELLGQHGSDFPLWVDPAARQKFVDEVTEKGFCENFEADLLTKDGLPRVSLISGKQLLIDDKPHVISIARDISERKEIELRMTHMAQHDALTDLPNRALFYDRLQQELSHAKRDGTRLALMFLDLDHFKSVNDTLGHGLGDALLKDAALRMSDCVRQSDTVGRIGGDEFVILLPLINDDQDALLVALKIRQALAQPFTLPGGHTVHISCSMGIATYPEHGEDEIELSKNADTAMYQAKDHGRNRVEFCRLSSPG